MDENAEEMEVLNKELRVITERMLLKSKKKESKL